MNNFYYQYPVRQHFGKGRAENALREEMKHVGKRVLLAYGGGSQKCTGLYDKIRSTWLETAGNMETYMGKPQSTNISDEINEVVMRNVIKNIHCALGWRNSPISTRLSARWR